MAGSSSSNDDAELAVAVAALLIAIIAFVTAVVQLAQSIIATARGLPNCDHRVMGQWADFNKRRLRFLRLEVDFESPVIFLSANNNKRGPVQDPKTGADTPIWYADGSDKSYQDFRVTQDQDEAVIQKLGRERVSSVDNELATWVTLLSAIQKMERDSRQWEGKQWHTASLKQPDLSGQAITLAVGIQRKWRSFDAIPIVKKPYATTTICHLIELASLLGLYWKEFNRDQNKYRAEGNGYSLLGTRVDNFGLVFLFEKTGWSNFGDTRIIPAREVKEICFGNLPTIYREKSDAAGKLWSSRMMEQKTLQTLQFGSRQEVMDTLGLIGCNTNTALYFQNEDPKLTIHLFPVVFEIMGMVGRTVHVMNRPFRFLPNPTAWTWNPQRFKVRRMLTEFEKSLRESVHSPAPNYWVLSSDLQQIMALAAKLERNLPADVNHLTPQDLDEIHKAIDKTDTILSEDKKDKGVVLDVLRRHIQEVVLAINTGPKQTAAYNQEQAKSPSARPPVSFDSLHVVPPESREGVFMGKYLNEIRIRVISIGAAHHDTQATPQDAQAAKASLQIHANSPQQNQQSAHDDALASRHDVHTNSPSNPSRGGGAASSGKQEGGVASSATTSPPQASDDDAKCRDGGPPHRIRTEIIGPGRESTSRAGGLPPGSAAANAVATWDMAVSHRFEPRRSDIWCTLVFRMLCWLLLHDFDKRDVQLSKSELMGSRLPVYIM